MNKKIILSGVLLFALSMLTMSFSSSAQIWEKLGSRSVSYKADWDEIMVTGREGRFRAIKLEVAKSDVDFDHVVVVYRNGQREKLQIRNKIPAGGQTRAINLSGKRRIINRVIFYYRTPLYEGRRARVTLYGI